MLLKAEDNANFEASIDRADAEIWASYKIVGTVNGEAVTQSDRQMFASELEARNWLVGEAENRGFHNFESKSSLVERRQSMILRLYFDSLELGIIFGLARQLGSHPIHD